MKCPECDAFVKSTSKRCPNCSAVLGKAGAGPRKGSGAGKGRSKRGRGGGSGSGSKIVDKRGNDEEFALSSKKGRSGREGGEEEDEPRGERSRLAAVLLGFAGVDALITAVTNFIIINEERMTDFMGIWNLSDEDVTHYVGYAITTTTVCNVVMIIAGLLVLAGAVLAFRKKNWQVAVLLGIIGLFSAGFMLTATICAAIGLYQLVASRREFPDFEVIDEK